MINSRHAERKMIWAIDPFEEPSKTKQNLIKVLQKISSKQKIWVEPVHVLNFSVENSRNLKVAHHQYAQYKRAASDAILEAIKGASGIHFLPPRVLLFQNFSLKELVQTLVSYATSTSAHCIVAGTHARHGLPRLVLGSFTETLLLCSEIPVITVGPECERDNSSGHLLFATDFNEDSETSFRKALDFASTMGLTMTLFHVISHRVEPIVQSGMYLLGGAWVSLPDFIKDKETQMRKIAEIWQKESNELGVPLNIEFDSERGQISEAILAYARRKGFCWIAMPSESGPVKAALVGSIVREVVRHAPCPVWVLP